MILALGTFLTPREPDSWAFGTLHLKKTEESRKFCGTLLFTSARASRMIW